MKIALATRLIPLGLYLLPSLWLSPPAPAQKRSPAPPGCDEQRALLLVQQQAAEARGFEDAVAQISVMTRAADLLWGHRRDAARAVFGEAFDLATKHYQKKGDESRVEGKGLLVTAPDQRFVVLRAVARHDAEWSRRLAEEVARETTLEAEKAAKAASGMQEMGNKLIELALSLLPVNRPVALSLARSTFGRPLTLTHPRFFFELAKIDRAAADALVQEAVNAYARTGTTGDLSYLSAYVFGLTRTIAPVRAWTWNEVPANFAAGRSLQESFLRALLARAELILKAPEQFTGDARNAYYWETTQSYVALTALEPLVGQHLPGHLARVTTLRARMQAAIGEQSRRAAASYERDQREGEKYGNFELLVEEAEAATDPDRRDWAIARTINAAKTVEQLNRVGALAHKLGDADARRQLLNWINFSLTQQLAKDGLLDEAKSAAAKVDQLDHRAILHLEIAREGLKRLDDRGRARELLDEVVAEAAKAPETDVKARTLLGVVHLYAEFDATRAAEVLADAVRTINTLKRPDLTAAYIHRRIEGKTFGVYSSYNVPGFRLENVFQTLGPHDFEGTLFAARKLDDPGLRATAVLGLAAHCLERGNQPPAPGKAVKPESPAPQSEP